MNYFKLTKLSASFWAYQESLLSVVKIKSGIIKNIILLSKAIFHHNVAV